MKPHMRNFSKKSFVLFLLLAAVATATGWFLVRETRKTGESLDKIGFVPVQIPKKPAVDTDLVDTSKWKTYRNEEYGFELKHPQDYVVVTQPGSSKTSGSFFLIENSDYAKLKDDSLFGTNPLLSLIENGSTTSFEMKWNGNEWVSQAFSSKNVDTALKDMIIGTNNPISHMGETYEKSFVSFRKIDGFAEDEIRYYELLTQKVGDGESDHIESGFALRNESLFIRMHPIIHSDSNLSQLMFNVVISLKNL